MKALPNLPTPVGTIYGPQRTITCHAYSPEQMREYARKCIELEREECAVVCQGVELNDEEAYYGNMMAAAIRKRTTE